MEGMGGRENGLNLAGLGLSSKKKRRRKTQNLLEQNYLLKSCLGVT